MTNNDDSLPSDEHDPEVSAQYRALAKDTTPNELDKIVLRAASKADKSDGSTGWSATWFRPVTFVATLGLSLALLLELSEFQFFDPPPDYATQADAPVDANVFQDAADSAAISVREVDATADESLQLSSPTLPANAAAAVQNCSDEQMVQPEKWWQCIQELRESGNDAAAELELANLQESFPQYMPAK
jgi:hypothetical protein